MTLKYTPISKRIQFAQNGRVIEKSPDGMTRADNTRQWSSSVDYDSSTGQFTDTNTGEPLIVVNRFGDNPANWTFSNQSGTHVYNPANRPTNQGEITQGKAPSRMDRFLAWSERNYNNPVLGAPARYAYTVKNNADPITGVVSFMPGVGDAVDLVSAGVSALRGNYGDAAVYSTAALLPFVNGKTGRFILNKLDPDSWLSRRLFGNNPNAVRRLRGEEYTEVVDGFALTRDPHGYIKVGGNHYWTSPETFGKVSDGMFLGRDGRYHFVENDPFRRSTTPQAEQKVQDVVENVAPQPKVEPVPEVGQEVVEITGEEVAKQAATKKPTRRPRKTKAQIDEEKTAAAREVAERARQEAFRKASRQYAALSDDEVMSSYREMAKSGKVDTPEYEAILQEGQARKMLDDNGRPISKSNGQKPADSSVEEPSTSTGTQEAVNNTTKKTDNKKGWKENLKKPLSSGLQLIWETKNHNFNDWYQARNAGRLLGAGLLGGQRIASGVGNVGPALWYGVGNSNKNDSTQVQTKTTSNNQQTTEQGDTAVAGDVKPNEQPVQVKKHQSFKDIMDQF